jgi:predicted transcriptional regulator of viral defense system
MSKSPILQLYKSQQTVFTAREIALIWQEDNSDRLKNKIKYYLDKGDLIRLRRGVYAKTDYNVDEAAIKIYKPSYISFETVLAREGVTFQYYETIFVASYLSREIKLRTGEKIKYRKLQNEILVNSAGMENKNGVAVATKERAFLDRIYLNPSYYFDNLSGIDWKKCFELVKIYNNKEMEKTLKNYYKNYA